LYDLAIPHLDLSLEHNTVRPFTYSHQDVYTSYTHYLQPLAHPYGSNFRETLFKASYQPFGRYRLQLTAIHAMYGQDEGNGISIGKNPAKSYNLREPGKEYGHTLGQGNLTHLRMFYLYNAYQLMHNLFLDISYTFRKESFEHSFTENTSSIFTAGFRLNITHRPNLF
ncbi:MAG: hypothetical protein OEY56_13750, partial [Cyclobacteriaceae bacterium]|nr:hypothetical protein [Cyclobacteriaceae bacterium]